MNDPQTKSIADLPPLPTAPSLETSHSLSPQQKKNTEMDLIRESMEIWRQYRILMPENEEQVLTRSNSYLSLKDYFRKKQPSWYVASDLFVFYPKQAAFAPDLLVTINFEDNQTRRDSWVVAEEGKKLDFVLEIVSPGDPAKDRVKNMQKYSALGIPEYFIFDPSLKEVHGYECIKKEYFPFPRINNRVHSKKLGLDIAYKDEKLCFIAEGEQLLFYEELSKKAEEISLKYEQSQEKLGKTEEKLGETEEKLGETENELGETKNKLGKTEEKLGEVNKELYETKSRIEEVLEEKQKREEEFLEEKQKREEEFLEEKQKREEKVLEEKQKREEEFRAFLKQKGIDEEGSGSLLRQIGNRPPEA